GDDVAAGGPRSVNPVGGDHSAAAGCVGGELGQMLLGEHLGGRAGDAVAGKGGPAGIEAHSENLRVQTNEERGEGSSPRSSGSTVNGRLGQAVAAAAPVAVAGRSRSLRRISS